jgi:uncharacterized protein involved in type VI secretion and phage assembly
MSTEFGDDEQRLERSPRIYGVVRAVVTNNQNDPYGRVKVSFINLPQLGESAWARMATPMAGKAYGLSCIPEVNDEVLVVFEQGDIDKPYIAGALWNGESTPPYTNADGKNNTRQLTSRSGHTVTFDDTKDKEQFIIRDKTGNNQIVFDSTNNVITISSAKDIRIDAKGSLSLSSDGDLNVSCNNFKVTAKQTGTLEANQSLDLKCMVGVKLNNDGLVVK